MKNILKVIFLMLLLGSLATTSVLAGDKVRGDKGVGDVNQECVEWADCPWRG